MCVKVFCKVEYGFGSETYDFSEKIIKVDLKTGKVVSNHPFQMFIFKLPFMSHIIKPKLKFDFGHGYTELAIFQRLTEINSNIMGDKGIEFSETRRV